VQSLGEDRTASQNLGIEPGVESLGTEVHVPTATVRDGRVSGVRATRGEDLGRPARDESRPAVCERSWREVAAAERRSGEPGHHGPVHCARSDLGRMARGSRSKTQRAIAGDRSRRLQLPNDRELCRTHVRPRLEASHKCTAARACRHERFVRQTRIEDPSGSRGGPQTGDE
jgi:hypothetical protein